MKKLLFFLALIINSAFADNTGDFTYQDSPINPACVAMFNSSFADYPYISSINLDSCQYSNAAYQKTLKKTADDTYYFYNNNKDERDGMYSYKVIGKTTNGIFVLSTDASGGGTLVASHLLLIQLAKQPIYI